MLKVLFIIAVIIIVSVVLFTVICALIISGRSDTCSNEESVKQDIFDKTHICSNCKTGKIAYDMDPEAEVCPYVGCWKNNKCHFYEPLTEEAKTESSRDIQKV